MKFVDNLSKEEYIKFFNKCKYSHFLQCYGWGKAIEKTREKKAIYVGLKDNDNNLAAAALLLKKALPLGYCYYYCSRGFLIDYNNTELLQEFSNQLHKFMKKTKAIYLKINPEIVLSDLDENANIINKSSEGTAVYKYLLNLGYKHKGFVKLYENNEPRYSFRRYFDNYKSIEEIENSISKTFMKTVKRSFAYEYEICVNDGIDGFYELNKYNAQKDNFVQYSSNFYQELYDACLKDKNIIVFNAYVNGQALYKKAKEEYESLNKDINNNAINNKKIADAKNKLERLKKELDLLNNYKEKRKIIVCSLINGIAGKQMWTMYIGNNELGEKLFAVNRLYYESIKYCFEKKFDFIDLYGTVGDPNTKYKNLSSLHDYKRKFGDSYIEFIGEFDLIGNKVLYYILPIFTKIYRKFISKKKSGN